MATTTDPLDHVEATHRNVIVEDAYRRAVNRARATRTRALHRRHRRLERRHTTRRPDGALTLTQSAHAVAELVDLAATHAVLRERGADLAPIGRLPVVLRSVPIDESRPGDGRLTAQPLT